MSKHLAGVYLSNGLLLAFSVAWLVLIFIPLLIATDHAMGLWYENNLAILITEAAICVFCITWSASRIIVYMKRSISKLRLQRQGKQMPLVMDEGYLYAAKRGDHNVKT